MDGKTVCNRVEHLREINKLRNVASCWLYSGYILAIHGPMNVKGKVCFSGYLAVCVSPLCQIWNQISCFDGRWNEVCTPERSIKLSKIGIIWQARVRMMGERYRRHGRVHQDMEISYRNM